MDDETIERTKFLFPAYGALYHAIKGLIFMRGDFAHRVAALIVDENDRNLKIKNIGRLRSKLFSQIIRNYNARVDKYELGYQKLSDTRKDDLEIAKFKLVEGMGDEDYSGRYQIFPRAFVCSKCGDYKNLGKNEWENFNPSQCNNPRCNGRYEQLSILMFCDECGKVTPLSYRCKEHGAQRIRLDRRVEDSLSTWRVVCLDCYEAGNRKPIDIFRFTCKHMDGSEKICNKEDVKFRPLTLKEGGVFTPVVITSVDIPSTESIQISDLEYILLGIHLGKFDEISKNICIEQIESYYQSYNNKYIKHLLPPLIKEYLDAIENTKNELKIRYMDVDLENFNDYYAIKSIGLRTYSEFIKAKADTNERIILEEDYANLKSKYGFEEIIYIPEINLVSSCIGVINGINKFYDPGFVPHFNPIWKDFKKRDKMLVYSYPFETEGLLIDLDKIQVCIWLQENDLIDKKLRTESEAKEILLGIKKDTAIYDALKTLLHTLSHLLIRRSSIYTGLESDSCSEFVFVNAAAILIYCTSNINIGGFEFVFEHSLKDWLRDIEFDAEECTLDPVCMFESGACFSCMFLQEYVCTEFNHNLDRDAFLGRKRYKIGYWRIKVNHDETVV